MRLLALLPLLPIALSAASQPDRNLERAIGESLYRIAPSGPGFIASNPAKQLDVRFLRQHAEFSSRGHHLSLALENAGRLLHTRARQNRIEFEHAGVTEWFVNTPNGIEQGFIVAAGSRRRGPLTLTLATSGDLRPALQGADVVFRDAASESILRYGDLTATDADGRVLPSRLIVVDGRNIRCEVDDRLARYPITIDPIMQQAALSPLHPPILDERFGTSVAIDGDTAVVGAPFWNDGTGEVYVFTRSGSIWTQQAVLSPPEAAPYVFFNFGWSVAISGDTLVVGAPYTNQSAGAAYVYTRTGSSWTGLPRITPSDASVSTDSAFDDFGVSVAIDGSTIVVGADDKNNFTGAAYVFSLSGTVLSQQAKLTASDAAAADHFGTSVAISGSMIIAGAPNKTISGVGYGGAAYAFMGSGASWTQLTPLTPSDGINGDGFGSAVATGDGTFIIGAPQKNYQAGAAYMFTQSGSSWDQSKIVPQSPGSANVLGTSVAIHGGIAAVGASQSVLLLSLAEGVWGERAAVAATGLAIATDGTTLITESSGTAATLFPLAGISLECSNSFDALLFASNVAGLGPAAPTGTVTFNDGPFLLGSVPLDLMGRAVYATGSLAPGTHWVSAAYGGDANYPASTSNPISVTIASPVASLVATPNPLPAGTDAVTLDWTAPGFPSVELVEPGEFFLHIVTTGPPPGSAAVGSPYAVANQGFDLLDTANQQVIASLVLQPENSAVLSAPPAYFLSDQMQITWDAPALNGVLLYQGSPLVRLADSQMPTPLAQGGTTGSATAGPISADEAFYLMNQESQQNVAVLFVRSTPTRPSPSASLNATPSIPLHTTSSGVNAVTLIWNAPGHATVAIHFGSPLGSTVAQGGESGSAQIYIGQPPAAFYLVDSVSGATLASATIRESNTAIQYGLGHR